MCAHLGRLVIAFGHLVSFAFLGLVVPLSAVALAMGVFGPVEMLYKIAALVIGAIFVHGALQVDIEMQKEAGHENSHRH